jgi:hypothetical protein
MSQPEDRSYHVNFRPEVTEGLDVHGRIIDWFAQPELMISPPTGPESDSQARIRRNFNLQRIASFRQTIESLGVRNKRKPHYEIAVGFVSDADLPLRRISLVIDEQIKQSASNQLLDQKYLEQGPASGDSYSTKRLVKQQHRQGIFNRLSLQTSQGAEHGLITETSGLQLGLVSKGLMRGRDVTATHTILGRLVDPETGMVDDAQYNHSRKAGPIELIGVGDERLVDMLGLMSVAEVVIQTKFDDM